MKQISQRALVFHTSHYSPTVTELGREIPTGKNWQKKKDHGNSVMTQSMCIVFKNCMH